MLLNLAPGFTFADFRHATPVDATTVLSMILSRHGGRMTVKRPAAAQENLRKIFDATFKLANKVGFSAMTLRDLCRESELSMGGLYGYINGKDDLAAIIEDVVRYLAAEIPAWFAHIVDPREQLSGTLRAHLFQSELLQPWFFFVFMESRMLSNAQRVVARSSELHIQEAIAGFIVRSGAAAEQAAEMLAAHLLAAIQDWHLKRWKYHRQKVTVDAFADSICQLADRALSSRSHAV